MYTEGLEQWLKVNKNFTNPLVEWNKVTNELCRRIAEQNLELIGENITLFSDQLKRISNAKKPEDFINIQKDILTEDMTAAVETTQKIIHIAMGSMEQCTKLCGSIRDTVPATTSASTKHHKEKDS